MMLINLMDRNSVVYKSIHRKVMARRIATEYRKKNADAIRVSLQKFKLTPEMERIAQLQDIYGITIAQYESMLIEQNRCCAICHKTEEEEGRGLSVDHNHRTGAIRGLLCGNCNRALGHAQDNPSILRALADYLERQPRPEVQPTGPLGEFDYFISRMTQFGQLPARLRNKTWRWLIPLE